MKLSRLLQHGLAAATLTAFASLAPAQAQNKDPIRIALVSAQSGTWAQQGEETIRAATFAIEQANAQGGVDGRKVEYQLADDESTPEGARRNAERLARSGYNFIIGPIASSSVLSLMPSLSRWNALLFAPQSKEDKITGESCHPYAFRPNHSNAMDKAMFTEWAKGFSEKTFATLASDYIFGRGSANDFKEIVSSQGKEVKLQLWAPLNTKDFAPYIAQIKEAGVETVWVTLVGRDAIAFLRQAREFNLDARLIGHSMMLNFMLQAAGSAIEGVAGNLSYSPDLDFPRNKAFVAAWQEKFNRLPTETEGLTYNGMQVIFDGVVKAGSVKTADVSRALRGATLDTLYGPALMRAEDNQLVMPNIVGVVKNVNGDIRSTIAQVFNANITPPASPLCKMR